MRILLFTTAYAPMIGGSEIAIQQIGRRLPDVFFDILTPRHSRAHLYREGEGNICIHRVGLGTRLDKYIFPFLGACVGAWLLIRKRHNIIHAYQASYGAVAAVFLSFVFWRVPMLLTIQEGKSLEGQTLRIRAMRALLIRSADCATAISRHLAYFIGIRNKKIPVHLIPNGVGDEFFIEQGNEKSESLRRELNIREGELVVLSVSRLVEKNGIGQFLRACAVIVQKERVRVLIVGDGPLRKTFDELVRSLGIKDKVTFIGAVPHARTPAYYGVADVFVRPSLSEGQGIAFLEGMAAGIPVIGSDVGGISDFLKDGETGIICDPKSPEDIAKKISLALHDKELVERITRQGRDLVRGSYTWNSAARLMSGVYRTLIK